MSKNRTSETKTYEFGFADQMQKADGSLFRTWYDRTCLLTDVTPATPNSRTNEPTQPDANHIPERLAA